MLLNTYALCKFFLKGVDNLFSLDKYSVMVRLLVLFTVMPVHECAHGLVANKLGDTTAERAGRLTLNPFAHLDIMGSFMMLIFGFGWAKPVPVNPNYFRKNPRAGMALTAAAGPTANILMAMMAMLVMKLCLIFNANYIFMTIFSLICQINITLAIFNLLPIYPLDGSQIFSFFFPGRLQNWLEEHQRAIYYVFIALLLLGALNIPLGFLSNYTIRFLDWITSLFGLLPRLT